MDLMLEEITQCEHGHPQNSFSAVLQEVDRKLLIDAYNGFTATNVMCNIVLQQGGSTAFIQFQEKLVHPCNDGCKCVCHSRSTTWRRSPLAFRYAIGLFSLHYNGVRLQQPACNSVNCRNFSFKTFTIIYCLPRWLLVAAAQVIMQSGLFGLTNMDLTLQRRTQKFTENSIYRLAENGTSKVLRKQ
jgi:hypothetical protein